MLAPRQLIAVDQARHLHHVSLAISSSDLDVKGCESTVVHDPHNGGLRSYVRSSVTCDSTLVTLMTARCGAKQVSTTMRVQTVTMRHMALRKLDGLALTSTIAPMLLWQTSITLAQTIHRSLYCHSVHEHLQPNWCRFTTAMRFL